MTDRVLFARAGALAKIVLNRPKSLNALDLQSIRMIAPQLDAWAADPGVATVAIMGAGERAFCAGGDVRALVLARREDPATTLTREFFWHEYRLNRQINVFPKPYVAVVDGIAMGGGMGLSVPGRFRAASEHASMAMPEMAIGLFPDVGASFYLTRAPGETGTYLALTGARVAAADMLYCGFATHHVPRAALPALLAALEQEPAEAALARFARDPGPAPLAAQRGAIDRCFGHDSVEEILAALEREGGAWADATSTTLLDRKSPTSLKVTLEELRRGRALSFDDCLRMEYRLVQVFMRGHDFFEGVRAVLIDKDAKPRWRPATLADVTRSDVEACFTSAAEELEFA